MDVDLQARLYETISKKDGFISRKGCQASRVTLLEVLVQPNATADGPQSSDSTLSADSGVVINEACEAPSCQKLRLWVSFHKNGKAFTPGWVP